MRIAIIGGIGSGKSEALKAARDFGLATLSADEINAELLASSGYAERLEKLFPTAVENGVVNKKTLAGIVFADATARERLNAVSHPLILKAIENDVRDPLVVEVPLILESGAARLFDEIIIVATPLEKRIERLEASRNMTKAEVQARIDAQVGEDALKQVATRTVLNDSTVQALRERVEEILKNILSKA